ncbi:MAG TPA: hypothetical protein VLQ67_03370 [Arachnia sp.]|nr:hypothetical protein [Arachnia sp.]
MSITRTLIISTALVLAAVFAAPSGSAPAAPRPGVITSYTDLTVVDAHDTHVTGVNLSGVVAGYFGVAPDGAVTHGFTATRTKKVTTITPVDVPGATSTVVTSINDSGSLSGTYWTGDGAQHGFIRVGDAFSTFDDPALVTTDVISYGTVATGINASGVVVGYSFTVGPDLLTDPEGNEIGPVTRNYGFVRSSGGDFTAYSAPGATVGSTQLFGINNLGDMVGTYSYLVDPFEPGPDTRNRGFVLTADDPPTFTEIVDPSSLVPVNACGWTEPHAINDAGVIVGEAGNGCDGTSQGWLLSGAGGTFTYPIYRSGRDTAQVTTPSSINNNGIIGGTWGSGIGVSHGFTATLR